MTPAGTYPRVDARTWVALTAVYLVWGSTYLGIAVVVAEHPRECAGWAALGDHASDPITRYAYYRVGYHRGLDALRANGWRGSGYVRWDHEGNRGFLRCLLGLSRLAGTIGEVDEEERCRLFLLQLDPRGVPDSV